MTSLKGPAGPLSADQTILTRWVQQYPKKFGAFSAGWGWEGSAWKADPCNQATHRDS